MVARFVVTRRAEAVRPRRRGALTASTSQDSWSSRDVRARQRKIRIIRGVYELGMNEAETRHA